MTIRRQRVFDAAGNLLRAPTPFPDNKIPANRIHQASQKLLRYYPTPDAERIGANFVNNEAREVNMDQYTYRIDYTQSSTMNWFFRHSISHELGYDPFAIPGMGSNTDTDVNQMVLGNTQTIGTNKLNDLRIGYGQLKNAHISPRANVENVVRSSASTSLATTRSTGACRTSASPPSPDSARKATPRSSTMTRRFSSSTTSRGFSELIREVRRRAAARPVRSDRRRGHARPVRFRRPLYAETATNGGAAGGEPFADFLLGHLNNAESQVGAPIADFRSNYYALYIQDNWKMTPNLTVDFGLRWGYDQPFTDGTTRSSISTTSGTTAAHRSSSGTALAIPMRATRRSVSEAFPMCATAVSAVAPTSPTTTISLRGSAWSVGEPPDGVRAGAGIYYVRDIGNAVFDTVRNAPFTIRHNEPAESFRPNLTFEQPFARTGSPTFILAAEYDVPSSYIEQWSLGFQRELPGSISAEVTYFGSRGVHLRRLQTYNNTEPSSLPNTNLSRPFPDLGGMQVMNAPSSSEIQRTLSEGTEAVLARHQLP